jgi:NhaP-type Na+/H+ and K+/H+ antiporter
VTNTKLKLGTRIRLLFGPVARDVEVGGIDVKRFRLRRRTVAALALACILLVSGLGTSTTPGWDTVTSRKPRSERI